MTDRLNNAESSATKRTAQDWADRGNRILAGHEPLKDGSFMYRNDVRWVVRDGRCTIEMAR
jgi:hypothetical protein